MHGIWEHTHDPKLATRGIMVIGFLVSIFTRIFLKMQIIQYTGGPPLLRKSLTRFPLPLFLAYVRVRGGISVSKGPQYSPTSTNFM